MSDRPDEIETIADPSPPYARWVQSILSHDPDAWTRLHEYHSGRLRRDIQISLRKWGLSPEFAGDIEQETWLTAVKRINEFVWVDDDRFYNWLRAISCNHIRTYRYKQKRFVSFDDFEDDDDGLDDYMDSYVWDSECIEDEVIPHERMAALDRVIRTLKPREREIIVRRMMGETPRELAAEYQLKPEHLRTLLLRSKKKIEAQLDPSFRENNSDE